eukprot:scaffold41824_cov69-Phaeocystis_antarctica.AAC.7
MHRQQRCRRREGHESEVPLGQAEPAVGTRGVGVAVARLARARHQHRLVHRRCQRRRAVRRRHWARRHAAAARDGQLASAPQLVERDGICRLGAPSPA